MDETDRIVIEGEQWQGEDEQIAYSITTTPWGSSPSNVAVVVKDESAAFADVTSTVMPAGSASVNGDVITLPILKSLTRGHRYRVEVKFTVSGNVMEAILPVNGQR